MQNNQDSENLRKISRGQQTSLILKKERKNSTWGENPAIQKQKTIIPISHFWDF